MQCTFVVPELPAAVVVAPVNSEGYLKKKKKNKKKKRKKNFSTSQLAFYDVIIPRPFRLFLSRLFFFFFFF